MLRYLVTLFVFWSIATSVVGATGYECKRTNLNARGFANNGAAESWYPKTLNVAYADNEKWAASYYGVDEKRSKNEREFGVSNYNAGQVFVSLRHNNKDQNSSSLIVTLKSSGLRDVTPTKYTCGPSYQTDYTPDF